MNVEEPALHFEYTKTSIDSESRRELHQLSEAGTEVCILIFIIRVNRWNSELFFLNFNFIHVL